MKTQLKVASLLATAMVTACGGGDPISQSTAQLDTGVTTLYIDTAVVAAPLVEPMFHSAPVDTVEPSDERPGDHHRIHRQNVDAANVGAPTKHLSHQDRLDRWAARHTQQSATPIEAMAAEMSPMAVTMTAATFTPAQIRSAYKLPVIPTGTLTAAQKAQLGAGQTIYIVDAMHNPNTAAELAAFNTKFGLPGCTTVAVPTTAVALPAASTTGCELSIIYSTPSGTMTTVAPAYNATWATEIALDVQWAHATAPLARIVVIEAPATSVTSLSYAIKLANSLGSGIVSLSFGAKEGSWISSYESSFTGANMTYLAATGDTGAAVNWPSVSANVLAVGGTTLNYDGKTRTEVSWSGTGGGVSAYVATPAYQTNLVPGLGTIAKRMVADVAFNADPFTGQYIATIAPGTSAVTWRSVGGTSLSTPQWAGIVAITNASRALINKPVVAIPHAALYTQISTTPSLYTNVFADITQGSDGTCITCTAKVGYDQLSGLGTPNVDNLLTALVGTAAPVATAPAPVVPAPIVNVAAINGRVSTPLTYTVTSTAKNAVTYTATGMPVGMTISSAGLISWSAPVVGTYSVIVTAKDSITGATGQATFTAVIVPGLSITATPLTGKVGVPFVGTFKVDDPAATSLSMTIRSMPLGLMTSISTGTNVTVTLKWAAPRKGTYMLPVNVTDNLKSTATALVQITIN
jgi:subtilase family serine protease